MRRCMPARSASDARRQNPGDAAACVDPFSERHSGQHVERWIPLMEREGGEYDHGDPVSESFFLLMFIFVVVFEF